jgi:hypothetical protein
MRKFAKWTSIWLALAVLSGLLTGAECRKYYKLSTAGETTVGVVRSKGPHLHVNYSFDVNGQEYFGAGRGDISDSPYYTLAVGDRLVVHYLSKNPDVSCLGDPKRLFYSELRLVTIAVIVLPMFVLGVLIYRGPTQNAFTKSVYVWPGVC